MRVLKVLVALSVVATVRAGVGQALPYGLETMQLRQRPAAAIRTCESSIVAPFPHLPTDEIRPDLDTFPLFANAQPDLDVVLSPGDAIVIPKGQVDSLAGV